MSVATVHTAQAGPAPYAFARGMLGPEAEEASRPGFDSGGDDFGGRYENVEDGDGCQIDVGGGLVGGVPQERMRSTAQLRLATQRSLPQ